MPTIRLEERIRATPARVFDAVVDVPSQRAFNPMMRRAEVVTPGAIGVGTRVALEVERVGAVELVIVEFARASHVAFEADMPSASVRHDFFVGAIDASATQLLQVIVIAPRGLARLASPGIGIVMRRHLRAVTRALRDALERATSRDDE